MLTEVSIPCFFYPSHPPQGEEPRYAPSDLWCCYKEGAILVRSLRDFRITQQPQNLSLLKSDYLLYLSLKHRSEDLLANIVAYLLH